MFGKNKEDNTPEVFKSDSEIMIDNMSKSELKDFMYSVINDKLNKDLAKSILSQDDEPRFRFIGFLTEDELKSFNNSAYEIDELQQEIELLVNKKAILRKNRNKLFEEAVSKRIDGVECSNAHVKFDNKNALYIKLTAKEFSLVVPKVTPELVNAVATKEKELENKLVKEDLQDE